MPASRLRALASSPAGVATSRWTIALRSSRVGSSVVTAKSAGSGLGGVQPVTRSPSAGPGSAGAGAGASPPGAAPPDSSPEVPPERDTVPPGAGTDEGAGATPVAGDRPPPSPARADAPGRDVDVPGSVVPGGRSDDDDNATAPSSVTGCPSTLTAPCGSTATTTSVGESPLRCIPTTPNARNRDDTIAATAAETSTVGQLIGLVVWATAPNRPLSPKAPGLSSSYFPLSST